MFFRKEFKITLYKMVTKKDCLVAIFTFTNFIFKKKIT